MLATARTTLMPTAPLAQERTMDNVFWRGAAPRLSICIPAYRHDVTPLMTALADCEDAGLVELIIHDDGGGDHDLLARLQNEAGRLRIAVRLIAADKNRGRSAARNAAIAHARADWVLLLDADMLPDDPAFLTRYLDAMEMSLVPSVIVGGYSLRLAPKHSQHALHRWQAEASECINATRRQTSPGRHVFSSNVLVHRAVLEIIPFDEEFSGWGWEDTDWGIRAAKYYPVQHIDNTATHLGLDPDAALMSKYEASGANFARLVRRHPDEARMMPLFRMAQRARSLPLRQAMRGLAGWTARAKFLPVSLRGRALKAWRALVYAEAL
jgi:glycosyltransferase involved in cell wall biosynthesis